ncbi:carbonic anhydrase family protein [Citrobacter gillenii]|uniref:carbonic anhydrase n=1 Tax=Citrobacter gillenii TaxID=67828 RepID=UPI00311CBCAA
MYLIRVRTTLLLACIMSFSVQASSWGYSIGDTSPEHWGEINNEYKSCQTGVNQSPINIQPSDTSKLGLPILTMQYTDSPVRFQSINHTLQATMNSYTPDTLNIDNQLYYLKQLDFHAPSEHTIEGKNYAMELQLLHKNQQGDTVIVAVMFDVDEPNQAIKNLWESFPTMEGSNMPIFSPVNINQLLPDNKVYWRYSGSLTIPPCSENVTWIVLKTPISLSTEQLENFRYIVGHMNNRPLQPLNGREVEDSQSGNTEILY